MEDDELARITTEALAWLNDQVAYVATPYGWSQCRVLLALVDGRAAQRSLLWRDKVPAFSVPEREDGLERVRERLALVPWSSHATATTLEVYLLDVGRILRIAVPDPTPELSRANGGGGCSPPRSAVSGASTVPVGTPEGPVVRGPPGSRPPGH